MDADEREIFHFLKTSGNQYMGAMEICRRATSKKRYREEPDWAKVVLLRMVERKLLESDSSGRYRIKVQHKKGPHKWVSPEINKILTEGGVEIDGAVNEDGTTGELASDEHYEQL